MFFSAIKEVYGPTVLRITPLLSGDGSTLLKEKSSINLRWRGHFSTLLNRPSTVDPTVLHDIPQKPVITGLDLPPTIDEVVKAIKQTSSGKSHGMDGIPAETFKSAGPLALEALRSVLTSIWNGEDVPREFRNATVVSLFKNRGRKTTKATTEASLSCPSLGRSWLRSPSTVSSPTSEESLPEAQCGFRPNRSTTDMIFSVRQVQDKCIKQNLDLVAVFIDLTKAFDTVNREVVWVILYKLGCPTKFVNLIRQFHDDKTVHYFHSVKHQSPSAYPTASSKGVCWLPSSSTCY